MNEKEKESLKIKQRSLERQLPLEREKLRLEKVELSKELEKLAAEEKDGSEATFAPVFVRHLYLEIARLESYIEEIEREIASLHNALINLSSSEFVVVSDDEIANIEIEESILKAARLDVMQKPVDTKPVGTYNHEKKSSDKHESSKESSISFKDRYNDKKHNPSDLKQETEHTNYVKK